MIYQAVDDFCATKPFGVTRPGALAELREDATRWIAEVGGGFSFCCMVLDLPEARLRKIILERRFNVAVFEAGAIARKVAAWV